MFWLILLWINPQTHEAEWAEQYGPAYEHIDACRDAQKVVDVPAVMVRNSKGVQLLPHTTCMLDNSRPAKVAFSN